MTSHVPSPMSCVCGRECLAVTATKVLCCHCLPPIDHLHVKIPVMGIVDVQTYDLNPAVGMHYCASCRDPNFPNYNTIYGHISRYVTAMYRIQILQSMPLYCMSERCDYGIDRSRYIRSFIDSIRNRRVRRSSLFLCNCCSGVDVAQSYRDDIAVVNNTLRDLRAIGF